MISGYVTRYGNAIDTASDLWKHGKKRTAALLLPWVVWTFGVRGLVLGKTDGLFDLKHIFWQMDAGYWFLITLWTIQMIFGVSQYLSGRFRKREAEFRRMGVLLFFYVLGMGVLGAVGLALGLSFFAIKQTLYYMPYYFAGYVYGQIRDRMASTPNGKRWMDAAVALCSVVWLSILFRVNLYALPDGGVSVAIRAIASLTGCVSICGLCKGLLRHGAKPAAGRGIPKLFQWAGVHSMEIYMTHYLLLCPIPWGSKPEAMSAAGIGLVAVNGAITLAMAALVIRLVSESPILRTLLYGRRPS